MKILVCISKTPDTTAKIAFTDNNTKFDTAGVQWIVNPWDEWFALVRAIEIKESNPDFVCLNFANCDMVGHTGVYPAVVKAVETVDKCVQQVVETGLANGYSFIITADHGNADFMINADGSPNTAHTTNPVPVFLIDPNFRQIHNGRLADLAPTILQLLGIKQPAEMTGKSLLDD